MEDKGVLGMTRILVDLVRGDRTLHMDCLKPFVGRECLALSNKTLSFAHDFPCL